MPTLPYFFCRPNFQSEEQKKKKIEEASRAEHDADLFRVPADSRKDAEELAGIEGRRRR